MKTSKRSFIIISNAFYWSVCSVHAMRCIYGIKKLIENASDRCRYFPIRTYKNLWIYLCVTRRFFFYRNLGHGQNAMTWIERLRKYVRRTVKMCAMWWEIDTNAWNFWRRFISKDKHYSERKILEENLKCD